jgi:hypothetical protein
MWTLEAAPDSPDWVARDIATASLLVAMLGLVLAWRVYQRAGARVRITIVEIPRYRIFRVSQGVWLHARIRNRGLAAIEVTSCSWEFDEGKTSYGSHRLPETKTWNEQGETIRLPRLFPQTVAGQHSFAWLTRPPDWTERETGRTAYRMRLRAQLGTGIVACSSWMIINKSVNWPEIKRLAGWRRVI